MEDSITNVITRFAVKITFMFVLFATIFTGLFATAYATDSSELIVELGEFVFDVEELAKEYNVDPFELKAAIEDGWNSDRASPFSNLTSHTPNITASESEVVETTIAPTGDSIVDVKVTKTNQDSTAYTSSSSALTASGKTPSVGMCAMKIGVTTKTGSTDKTTVRLGTTIYMTSAVNVNGTTRNSFVVEDRGSGSSYSDYWIDIYFGLTSSAYNAAINYGVKTVSYYYYYTVYY